MITINEMRYSPFSYRKFYNILTAYCQSKLLSNCNEFSLQLLNLYFMPIKVLLFVEFVTCHTENCRNDDASTMMVVNVDE